jgi:hypothetical protein
MDLQVFYAALRRKKEELRQQFPEGCTFVMSLDSDDPYSIGGRVCEVNVDTAARVICEKTHRLASKEEILTHQRNTKAQQQALDAFELKMQQRATITVRR